MVQLGIDNKDVNEFFDIMDDRVYDKKQDDDINDMLLKKSENKLKDIHQKREEILRVKNFI